VLTVSSEIGPRPIAAQRRQNFSEPFHQLIPFVSGPALVQEGLLFLLTTGLASIQQLWFCRVLL
jgi:hypothetical protein